MSDRSLPPSAEHRTIGTNGVRLHAVTAGPTDGPTVVLLHGFPEFWYGWRSQIPALVDAGYRVVVPDQRGYNRSDKLDGVDAYAVDTLAADAVGLLDALGYERARFVGHDWGAGVLWQVLLRYPERVRQAVPMNVPHPVPFEAFLARKPTQWLRSWYMAFVQVPAVPEWAMRAADWRGLRWFIDTSNRPDTFTEADLKRYRDAWARPGAATGMLNWYRALFRAEVSDLPTTEVTPPTLLVWGAEDTYLHRGTAGRSVEQCADGRLELVEDATHWVHHEAADRVNGCVLEFFAE